MRKFGFHGLRFVAFGLVAAGVFGLITTGLWNALMPPIFGLPTIGFWQALGLLLLSRILFGRLGGPGRRGWGHRHRMARFARTAEESLTPEELGRFREAMRDRFRGKEGLTPEERERFLRKMGHGCGGFDKPAPETRL
jgi:hypothetical protein